MKNNEKLEKEYLIKKSIIVLLINYEINNLKIIF
jgi:hypothetical protein